MSLFVVVDQNDKVIGSASRSEIYSQGLIHRIVRILIVNDKNELLLQLRAHKEDTLAGKWDQSAGGHVDEAEEYDDAAYRELKEELGVENVELKNIGKFYTDGKIDEKIIRRFNMVYIGKYSGEFKLQKDEVSEVKWFSKEELLNKISKNPEKFTHGLRTVMGKYNYLIFK